MVTVALTSPGCVARIDGGVAARQATKAARVGAYYFDGWAGPLDSPHLRGLTQGDFANREPLTGWQDNSPTVIDRQLRWAKGDGVDFFVFDWYYRPELSTMPYLNSALNLYRSLPNHHGVGYALLYVNDHQWSVPAGDWQAVVQEWVAKDFQRPDYVRVDGKPLLVILDVGWMLKAFGGPRGVGAALSVLRKVARDHGLPGVFVVGGAQISARYPNIAKLFLAGVSYDALTAYNYLYAYGQAAATAREGPLAYRELSSVSASIWSLCAGSSPLPYVPVVVAGWDPRPWRELIDGKPLWFTRSPAAFQANVRAALGWQESNPSLDAGPPADPPLLFVEAWNELGEGSYLVPTRGDGDAYGAALREALLSGRPAP